MPLPLYYFAAVLVSGGVPYTSPTKVVAFWPNVRQELGKLRRKQKLGCMCRAEPEKASNLATPLPLYYFTAEMDCGGVLYAAPTKAVAF